MKENIANTALLVIDVQQGLFTQKTPVYKENEILSHIKNIIDYARTNNLLVIFIQHSNKGILRIDSEGWKMHPEIIPLTHEPIILKTNASAFQNTILNELLIKNNIHKIFSIGLTTHGCVKATCNDALKLGYDVTLVSDAHTSFSEKAEVLIETWNKKLEEKGIKLKKTIEIINI